MKNRRAQVNSVVQQVVSESLVGGLGDFLGQAVAGAQYGHARQYGFTDDYSKVQAQMNAIERSIPFYTTPSGALTYRAHLAATSGGGLRGVGKGVRVPPSLRAQAAREMHPAYARLEIQASKLRSAETRARRSPIAAALGGGIGKLGRLGLQNLVLAPLITTGVFGGAKLLAGVGNTSVGTRPGANNLALLPGDQRFSNIS